MNTFIVDILDEETFHLALRPFIKAMGFAEYYGNEEKIEKWITDTIEMFYKEECFHYVGVRDNQNNSSNYIGFSSLISLKTTGWIPYVGIDPKFQGHGLGKRLMTKILEIARDLQLETIEICSSQAGIPFYQSLGFEVNYPVNGYDIVKTNRKP